MYLENELIKRLESAEGKLSNGKALEEAAARIKCEKEVLEAVLTVESGNDPYDNNGRLHLLPEAHVFYKQLPEKTRAAAVKLGLARQKWNKSVQYKGLGGSGSDARWERVDDMAELNEAAALESCSWGKAQIMGFHFRKLGYNTVQDMVMAFAQSEEEQDAAFIRFLVTNSLEDELRDKDFKAIARVYNGSGQVTHYAGLMARQYEKLTGGKSAKVSNKKRAACLRRGSEGYRVEALQRRLNELGYHVKVDGDYGPGTYRAVVAFQSENGIDIDGAVGSQTQEALDKATPIQRPEREAVTATDLKGKSRIVNSTTKIKQLVIGSVGTVSAVGGIEETGVLDKVETLVGNAQRARGVLDQVQDLSGLAFNHFWLILPIIAVFVWWWANRAEQARVEDEQSGKTV